jgi:lysophospholipase L1-like esterase
MAFVKFYLPRHHYYTMPLPNEYQRNDFAASDQNRHFGMNNRLDIDFTMDTSPPLAGPPSHAMEASASFFMSSTLSLLSHVLSTIFGGFTFILSSLASILLPTAAQLQRVGETLLATFLLLSVIQALVALYQYRYDARGQLVFPGGLTYGEEDYYANHDAEKSSNTTLKNGQDDKPTRATETDDMPTDSLNATIIDNINDSNLRRILTKFNKSLVLLLPWITQNVHNLLTKNTHLFHIGFIIFILDSLLPLLDGDIDRSAHDDVTEEHDKLGKIVSHGNDESSIPPNLATALAKKVFSHPSNYRNPIRILVIGDSLAIGTGCVDRFDIEKTNAIPMALIENNVARSRSAIDAYRLRQGPVFPRILARTLSYHMHRPVQWRSAGVDGGSVSDVQTFCMDVVKQEQAKGVDVIVVLFGMNDLKKHLSVNPFPNILLNRQEVHGGKGVAGFRLEMDRIISEIHAWAPDALVVFPALPIQPFHKNSIINIFPLGLMVDTFVGLWERQKKIAAISRDNVVYVDLKAKEIAEWYTPKNAHNDGDICDDIEEDVLLSGDGVHPNRAMYAKWAELVGHKLYKCILTKMGEQLEEISEEQDVQLDNNAPAKRTEPNQLRA